MRAASIASAKNRFSASGDPTSAGCSTLMATGKPRVLCSARSKVALLPPARGATTRYWPNRPSPGSSLVERTSIAVASLVKPVRSSRALADLPARRGRRCARVRSTRIACSTGSTKAVWSSPAPAAFDDERSTREPGTPSAISVATVTSVVRSGKSVGIARDWIAVI